MVLLQRALSTVLDSCCKALEGTDRLHRKMEQLNSTRFHFSDYNMNIARACVPSQSFVSGMQSVEQRIVHFSTFRSLGIANVEDKSTMYFISVAVA